MIIDEKRKMLYGCSNDGTIKAWYLKSDERILNCKFKGHEANGMILSEN